MVYKVFRPPVVSIRLFVRPSEFAHKHIRYDMISQRIYRKVFKLYTKNLQFKRKKLICLASYSL